jgi:fibro-slime domain-containing protein
MGAHRFIITCMIIAAFLTVSNEANADLYGTYYNLASTHPDMQVWNGGTGMVETALTGARPTLTALGSATYKQFDWWDSTYKVFSRFDSDADLQSAFTSSWWPIPVSLPGDPQHFAVHWTGRFYVDEDKSYTYSMGSDDDSWLFIDNALVLDLGGVHAMSYADYTLDLTKGYHDIEIFFAERYTVQSGFRLNFFSDLEPVVPVPGAVLLGMLGLATAGSKLRRKRS